PSVEDGLIKALASEALARDARHVELRETKPRPSYPTKTEKVAMLLDLPDQPEQLWQSIGSKVRAQIKAGQANDLRVAFGSHELLHDCYTVFAHNMRDLGTPVYGKRLVGPLLDQTSLAPRLVVLYCKNKPVSCGFLLGYRGTLEIPWASTLRSVYKLIANMLLYWHMLEFAINQGYKRFDFGRSSKDANTFRFKKQWGATPRQLYWHYWLADGTELPEMNPKNPKFQLLIAVWRRMPVALTTLIGPGIVRNLP